MTDPNIACCSCRKPTFDGRVCLACYEETGRYHQALIELRALHDSCEHILGLVPNRLHEGDGIATEVWEVVDCQRDYPDATIYASDRDPLAAVRKAAEELDT